MGLLATWDKYSTYVDANGKYRVIWQFADGNILFHKFDTFRTLPELDAFFAQYLIEQEFGSIEKLQVYLPEDEELIKEVVIYIRAHPALTLTQWNTYLNAMTYEKRAIIKAFIHKLALGLALHYGVVLADYTETEILKKTRNWICGVNVNVLKRICYDNLIFV